MSPVRTRSSNVASTSTRAVPNGRPAAAAGAKRGNVPPRPAPQMLAFLANIGQDIIPAAPAIQQTMSTGLVEDIPAALAQADLPLGDLPDIPLQLLDFHGALGIEAPGIMNTLEPALPTTLGISYKMYSNEDIQNIIKEAMASSMKATSNSVITPPNEVQENAGSFYQSETTETEPDVQSIIDISESSYNTCESRRVPVKEFVVTSSHQSTQAIKINISNDGVNNRSKLADLNIILNECDLFSLAEGSRKPVASSEWNPNGYTHDYAKNIDGIIKIIKKDDYFKYSDDCTRLFTIMNLATNKDLHYLVAQHLRENNGVAWYKTIKAFAQGERSNECGLSRQLLDDLKLPGNKSIKENIAAFEEAILRVNNVNLTVMTESEKLYLIYKKLKDNKQEGMSAILYTAKATSKDYRQLVDMLYLADCPTVKNIKINALIEDNVCRNYLKGACTYGDRCKYSHSTSKAPGQQAQEKKAYDKSKKVKTKYQPPAKKVTADHR